MVFPSALIGGKAVEGFERPGLDKPFSSGNVHWNHSEAFECNTGLSPSLRADDSVDPGRNPGDA